MAATQQEVDRVLSAYENAKEAQNYANSMVLEMRQNTGEDYTMVWNNEYPASE